MLFHADRRRIGGCGHFRSRDKDGGHTIRSAISKKPMLYANFTTLSFIEPELLPTEVLHCGNREFCVFLQKSGNYFKKFSHPKNDLAVAEAHFLIDCSSLYATRVRRIQSVVLRRIGDVVTSDHVTKMAVTPFDPQWPTTPCYMQTSRLSFIEPELLPIEVLHCGNREFRIFCEK